MTTEPQTDSQYYQVAKPQSLAERVVIAARDRIFADFIDICAPEITDTLLDVGVSDVVTDAANLLERLYPHPERITAAGIGDGRAFREEYPRVPFVRISPNEPLPFADKSFDIAAANAVLEHVGSTKNQSVFVSELSRVAKTVYITVPHRFFPVEHHTGLPFAHYTDATFKAACALLGRSEWTRHENLILMTRTRLTALMPKEGRWRIGYTGIKLGPFSSNLYLTNA